ncbi:3' terminal RNA ribose 2'-O-methyltransferase Hen1 [Desulfosporosinus sp.]|uniref:3' terminal RNA ribose 2'-O-methyltransferase Hen1 n=1 Tax=Desulfosporosinus sp. TaxID=157907 RepID=UPI0025B7DB5B|nr:3' terminal RNA ribose 2'-O-methyltransferase Hen1 [Desulfosporosinus sp.]MBC2724345.1 3' terminal RNA ribose 2'-O-methyltransferase Hen1 [Desulfosporosinus sp.]MBC2725502.1 3' terminal RNA ribose 2'-O-methyltransferase Hen1 [Desulfosporosinus sp.]
MQLAIKAVGEGARALSFLLAKNPQNLYDRTEKGYRVRLTYTVFTETEVEVILFVTPDPVELVKNSPDTFKITQYINDREFVVSSIFCSYARSALATAINGRTIEEYLPWVTHAFQLNVSFGPVATDLSDSVVTGLFEPLGFQVIIERGDVDYLFKLKDKSSARFLHLQGRVTLQNTLNYLYVLIPVLDDYKHYFMDEREIEKLQRYGEGWLANHPFNEVIIKRSLRFRELIDKVPPELMTKIPESFPSDPLDNREPAINLNELRYETIVKIIETLPSKETIVDFGSGEGKLSVRLGLIPQVQEILAVEPTERLLLRAMKRFAQASLQEGFISPTPIWGSFYYYDERVRNKDVMILGEVIEHIDEHRLPRVMDTIFGSYQPKTLIITTPNVEYNQVYEMEEEMRHKDHRFEWTRAEFIAWCNSWADQYSYGVKIDGIGQEVEGFGQPSQIAIFTRQVGSEK